VIVFVGIIKVGTGHALLLATLLAMVLRVSIETFKRIMTMTTMLLTLAKKDLATIKASAKAWDVLQAVIGLENYSEALALSYLDCLVEQLEAACFTNEEYKAKISKRKKVLLFAAGACKGMESWEEKAIDIEVNTMLCMPSLEKAYKFASDSLKLAKAEPEDEGSEGSEGSEGEGSTVTLSESKQALVRLAIDLIATMPDNKTDDAYDDLLDLFARYEG
jgi:hypothetical protein